MPNPVADETIVDLIVLQGALSGLNRSFRWARTHEGERYWTDVSTHLQNMIAYAQAHPEAVVGGRRRTRETTNLDEPEGVGQYEGWYGTGRDGRVYRWMSGRWQLD